MQRFIVTRKPSKVRTEMRERADVFVVADWRKPGQRDTWHARLRGARLASWELVVHNKGPSTVYTKAIATQRHVW
eukprot:4253641-Alexandrium_andersonii.AAC.1